VVYIIYRRGAAQSSLCAKNDREGTETAMDLDRFMHCKTVIDALSGEQRRRNGGNGRDERILFFFQGEYSSLRIIYVMQSRTTTVTHVYLKTSVFILYYSRHSCFVLSIFLFPIILCFIPNLHLWTWLYSITMLLRRLYAINPATGSSSVNVQHTLR
jgi:hypothetical protein